MMIMMNFNIDYKIHCWVDIESLEFIEYETHLVSVWIGYSKYHYEFKDADITREFIHILQKFNDDGMLDKLDQLQVKILIDNLHILCINGKLTSDKAMNIYENILLEGGNNGVTN